jgi:sugar phosphate isomerase/epimerase
MRSCRISHRPIARKRRLARRFAVCELSTFPASFEEDVAAYVAAGADGISIFEGKLVAGREAEQLETLRASGLGSSAAVTGVPSVLPLPKFPGPDDLEQRVEAIVAGMRRLAPFEPSAFVCPTGPAGERSEDAARQALVEGMRTVGEEGQRLGIPVGLEPMSSYEQEDWTLVTTLGDAANIVDEIDAGVGLVFDTWHLWDTPGLEDDIARYGDRFVAVQVNDWRSPTRSWCDRVLPGDGVIELAPVLDAVERTGWAGWYDLEVFSDDGTFGNDFEDSLWRLAPRELAQRGRARFMQLTSSSSTEGRAA